MASDNSTRMPEWCCRFPLPRSWHVPEVRSMQVFGRVPGIAMPYRLSRSV